MPEFDPKTRELLTAMLLMAGLLVIIALGIQIIAIYRRRLNPQPGDLDAELADAFREAYESGELSTDEYRQIQEALERGQAPPEFRITPSPPAAITPEGSDSSVPPDLPSEAPTETPEEKDSEPRQPPAPG